MRDTFLPYCLPLIGEEEIAEVVDSLRSGWVTTGPKVKRFEEEFAAYVGARNAIAVNSCTAALHIALTALGVGPGDEVIVPTLTFCATGNVVAHLGAKPVVVDIDEHWQLSLEAARAAITPRTKAIVPVHYAGQAADLDRFLALGAEHGIPIVEDAAHAAGSEFGGRRIGTHGTATCFSFYATKNMTTGEGGMITTNDDALAARMRLFALHGMSRDAWKRYSQTGSWYYEVHEAGYKDNMTDVQAALGLHQLRKLDGFNRARMRMASRYSQAFAGLPGVHVPVERPGRNHIHHIYPLWLDPARAALSRDALIEALKEQNIGTSVHFIPLHRHPFYQRTYGYGPDQFPAAEKVYEGLISLPLYPKMSDEDADHVITAVAGLLGSSGEMSGDETLALAASEV